MKYRPVAADKAKCAEEALLRREDSAKPNQMVSAEAKPSLRSRSLEQCAPASAQVVPELRVEV